MNIKSASVMKTVLGSILVVGIVPGLFGTAGAATTVRVAMHYYVDCAAGNDAASGTTTATPWKTLSKVNSVKYDPGDVISIRSGSTCPGTLMPIGSGTATAPIVVNSYSSGGTPKIVASGTHAAVFLHNVQGWEIRNLDITNQGNSGTPLVGIYVELEDYGIGQHFVADSVFVHDVNGCDCTGPTDSPSGGILFNALGSTTPTGFNGIKVSNSTLTHVNGIGIGTESQWARRDFFYPDGPGTFVPITGVVMENNRLTDLGGDGIRILNGSDALAQRNFVDGFGLRASSFHAGIWSFNSDRTLIQYNEIANGGGPLPAEAFDVDAGNDKMVYRYNYTHGNNGGMLLGCADPNRRSRDAVIQFNTSYNDLDGAGGVITMACAPQDNFTFTNNNVNAPGAATIIKNVSATRVSFIRNIFTGRSTGSVIDDPYSIFKDNVFKNITNAPF
jgi:hypothetical protein